LFRLLSPAPPFVLYYCPTPRLRFQGVLVLDLFPSCSFCFSLGPSHCPFPLSTLFPVSLLHQHQFIPPSGNPLSFPSSFFRQLPPFRYSRLPFILFAPPTAPRVLPPPVFFKATHAFPLMTTSPPFFPFPQPPHPFPPPPPPPWPFSA